MQQRRLWPLRKRYQITWKSPTDTHRNGKPRVHYETALDRPPLLRLLDIEAGGGVSWIWEMADGHPGMWDILVETLDGRERNKSRAAFKRGIIYLTPPQPWGILVV